MSESTPAFPPEFAALSEAEIVARMKETMDHVSMLDKAIAEKNRALVVEAVQKLRDRQKHFEVGLGIILTAVVEHDLQAKKKRASNVSPWIDLIVIMVGDFGMTDLLPCLVEIAALPYEEKLEVFNGSAVTETDLAITALAAKDPDLLWEIAGEEESLNRRGVCIEALLRLAKAGVTDADEVYEFTEEFLTGFIGLRLKKRDLPEATQILGRIVTLAKRQAPERFAAAIETLRADAVTGEMLMINERIDAFSAGAGIKKSEEVGLVCDAAQYLGDLAEDQDEPAPDLDGLMNLFLKTSGKDLGLPALPPGRAPLPARDAALPSRNGPCPCGSGKKYKQCCEKKDGR